MGYDQGRHGSGRSRSSTSVYLTAENIVPLVFRSSDVWYVHVYDPEDSDYFHSAWEESAEKLRQVAKFGQLDIKREKAAAEFFPHRIVVTPIVFSFVHGEEPGQYVPSHREAEESVQRSLVRFVEGQLPEIRAFPGQDGQPTLQTW